MDRIERCPKLWQTLTFPDDVMVGKHSREPAVYSSDLMYGGLPQFLQIQ